MGPDNYDGDKKRSHFQIPPRDGFDVTDAVYNTLSSIRRVPEHHMMPGEVCDGQDPARSTSYGRDTDIMLPVPPGPENAVRNGF